MILSDVMFFLAESNGKLSFFTQDNKVILTQNIEDNIVTLL